MLPFVYEPSVGEHGALHAHLARNNPQWSEPATGESLIIIQGADAYISPSWYASKAEHGRVVPTWNYSTAHVYGNLVIHDDPGLARQPCEAADRLTMKPGSERPWTVDDAPERYIAGPAARDRRASNWSSPGSRRRHKLSQNRPDADIDGVVAGLRGRGQMQSAADVEHARAQAGEQIRCPHSDAPAAPPGLSPGPAS